MSGSRSKKSGGKYDNPKVGSKVPKMIDSTKYETVKGKPKIKGSGMAAKAGKDLKESREKRFPDPDKY